MLFPKIFINKFFLSSLWFRYIFLSYSYLYFYIVNPLLKENINFFLSNLYKNINGIGFKVLFSLKWLFDLKKFNFLKYGKFLLFFSNDYNNFIINENITLYLISFSYYFINSYYFNKLFLINSFYNFNFFFFSKYNTYCLINILKYIYLLFKILIMYYLKLYALLINLNKFLLIIKIK